jgi:glycine/D-amino acid oxidase-like deaminating enzyme
MKKQTTTLTNAGGLAGSTNTTTTIDTLIIGAGLAGLGCALGLSREGQNIMVIDKIPKPDFSSGKLRYDPTIPASYKSAGMYNLLIPHATMLNYFMKTTAKEYEGLNLAIRHGGMSVIMDSTLATVFEEITNEKKTLHGYELKPLEPREPHIRFDKIKGVVRQEEAMNANPEETMQALVQAVETAGVKIQWGTSPFSAIRNHDQNIWIINLVGGGVIQTKNVIIAAGPWSTSLAMSLFALPCPLTTVVGVITEFEASPENGGWFRGLVMGARSIVAWTFDNFLSYLDGKDRIEITRKDGSKMTETTHLYISCQEKSGSVFVGGPRIEVADASKLPETKLNPTLYKTDMEKTIKYAQSLVDLPSKRLGSWCGLMAFTSDDMPIVGRAPGLTDVFVCTGFASGGYREAVGAGVWLSKCIATNNGKPLVDESDPDQAKYREIDPEGRIGLDGTLTKPQLSIFERILGWCR